MAEKTERQAVIDYFVENKVHMEQPVDLAIAMQKDKQDRTRQHLIGSKDYIDRTLKAGYKSQAMTDLFKDIQAARKTGLEKK